MRFPIPGGSIISLPFSGNFLRVCMQGSHSMSGWPIVKCHFRVHGYHFLVDSTVCDVGRGRGGPRPEATDHAFVGD